MAREIHKSKQLYSLAMLVEKTKIKHRVLFKVIHEFQNFLHKVDRKDVFVSLFYMIVDKENLKSRGNGGKLEPSFNERVSGAFKNQCPQNISDKFEISNPKRYEFRSNNTILKSSTPKNNSIKGTVLLRNGTRGSNTISYFAM